MTCGIYKIENNLNHQVYIGQARNIEQRWSKHRRSNDKCSIHQAFKKYGLENFTFSIIEECPIDKLDEREIFWIAQYDSYNHGYNETKGGQGSSGSTVKLTQEQVYEIQNLLRTTTRTNSDIGNEFGVSENMISGINTGYYWKDDTINYPIRKSNPRPLKIKAKIKTELKRKTFIKKRLYYCETCGKELKTKQAHLCPECAALIRRKVERPSKEALYEELKAARGNFSAVGRKYGVTDNSIRKWCTAYQLPTHSSDYKEQKIKNGRKLPSVKVQQIDKKTGILIREFDSLTQAEKETGIDHIIEASDPKNTARKSAGGYIWKRIYPDDQKDKEV